MLKWLRFKQPHRAKFGGRNFFYRWIVKFESDFLLATYSLRFLIECFGDYGGSFEGSAKSLQCRRVEPQTTQSHHLSMPLRHSLRHHCSRLSRFPTSMSFPAWWSPHIQRVRKTAWKWSTTPFPDAFRINGAHNLESISSKSAMVTLRRAGILWLELLYVFCVP